MHRNVFAANITITFFADNAASTSTATTTAACSC
jgi:hypothetical protein